MRVSRYFFTAMAIRVSAAALGLAALCLPDSNGDFAHLTEVVPGFGETHSMASVAVPRLDALGGTRSSPGKSTGAIAFQDPGRNKTEGEPREVYLWGNVETDFGGVSGGDRIEIYSSSLNKGYTTISDENGYFYIESIASAVDYRLSVTPRGMFKRYEKKRVALTSDRAGLTVVLQTLPTSTLHATVVNVEGMAVPGFPINVRSSAKGRWSAATVTDEIGRFSIQNVPHGPLEFSSMAGQVLRITGYRFDGERRPANLVVDQGEHELSGLVYDQFNDPIAGAYVLLHREIAAGETRSVVNRRTITDPSGFFSIAGIGGGEHELVLAAAGAALKRTVDLSNQVTDLTFVLDRTTLSR